MDLDLLDMEVPGVVLVMSEADPLVVSDDLLVETEDGLIPGLSEISQYFHYSLISSHYDCLEIDYS